MAGREPPPGAGRARAEPRGVRRDLLCGGARGGDHPSVRRAGSLAGVPTPARAVPAGVRPGVRGGLGAAVGAAGPPVPPRARPGTVGGGGGRRGPPREPGRVAGVRRRREARAEAVSRRRSPPGRRRSRSPARSQPRPRDAASPPARAGCAAGRAPSRRKSLGSPFAAGACALLDPPGARSHPVVCPDVLREQHLVELPGQSGEIGESRRRLPPRLRVPLGEDR